MKQEIIDDKHLIKVDFLGDNSPYSAYGRYYLKTADEDREVTPEELQAFFERKNSHNKWENERSEIKFTQVDPTTINNFCIRAMEYGRLPKDHYDSSTILQKFHLISGDYLTNAGEVLFGNNHPVVLKVAIFASDEKLTILNMNMYEDNILNLINIAEQYIQSNIHWRAEIKGTERIDIPEIPIAAIREVIANGFAHSIYKSKTYHEICIHPSMITIYSPGPYASKYLPEEYINKNVESEIRNEIIAKILYINKSIEQFGSGFRRINSLCQDSNVRYSYEQTSNGFKFILYRNRSISIDEEQKTLDLRLGLNGTEKEVLEILRFYPNSSRDQIASMIFKSVRTVQRTLTSLKEKGLIKRVGNKKSFSWVVLNKSKKSAKDVLR